MNHITYFEAYVTLTRVDEIIFVQLLQNIRNLNSNHKNYQMNLKRVFGAILTILGISGLIYAAVLFANNPDGNRNIRSLIIYGILGFVFFIAGISLVRTTKDES